jgi:hypothetical protein
MDQAAWVVANEPGDVFDPGGAGARWAPATRRGIMQSYGRWLTWLTCTRPGDLDLPFVDRLKPVPIAAYIADLQCVNASCTVWTRVALLADAIQAMAPETDLIWMRKVIVRLHRLVEPVRLKRHRLVESAALFTLGMDTMADAESAAVPAWRRAQRYLDGLMRSIAIYCVVAMDISYGLPRRRQSHAADLNFPCRWRWSVAWSGTWRSIGPSCACGFGAGRPPRCGFGCRARGRHFTETQYTTGLSD